jgi:hypothetical protein
LLLFSLNSNNFTCLLLHLQQAKSTMEPIDAQPMETSRQSPEDPSRYAQRETLG